MNFLARKYGYLFWGELPADTFVLGALFIALASILTLRRRAARDRGGSSLGEGQTS